MACLTLWFSELVFCCIICQQITVALFGVVSFRQFSRDGHLGKEWMKLLSICILFLWSSLVQQRTVQEHLITNTLSAVEAWHEGNVPRYRISSKSNRSCWNETSSVLRFEREILPIFYQVHIITMCVIYANHQCQTSLLFACTQSPLLVCLQKSARSQIVRTTDCASTFLYAHLHRHKESRGEIEKESCPRLSLIERGVSNSGQTVTRQCSSNMNQDSVTALPISNLKCFHCTVWLCKISMWTGSAGHIVSCNVKRLNLIKQSN